MKTKKDVDGKYIIERPSAHKQEYHGNGKNAWTGEIDEINGHKIEYVSKRYSYRWHKTHVYFDDSRLLTAKDYRDAEEKLNK